MVQTEQGIMYFATRSGVLEFDGRNWNLIPGKGAIYSLQIDAAGDMYWAGADGYGKLEADDKGFLQLKTWSRPEVKDVYQCLVVKDKVYFLTDVALYMHKEETKPIRLPATTLSGSFTGMTELFGSIYLNTGQGILKADGDHLVATTLGFSNEDEILFSSAYQNMYIVGLANNKLYLCGEDLRPREMVLEDQPYITASVVVSGSWVNRDLLVLGTLRGGLIFIHAASGKTQEIINYSTGLPDNEVYALMNDKSQSIWLAHEYGFTRVSPYLPFRSFSHYDGLQGNLLCALSLGDQVYVGTSLGLYALQKEEVFEEVIHYDYVLKPAKKEVKKEAAPPLASPPAEETKPPVAEAQSKKKGFLWFLKRKRVESKPTTEGKADVAVTPVEPEATSPANTNPAAKPSYQRIKKVEKVLRSAHYVYKKVAGIDAKITSLEQVGDHLVAAGLGGAYEVTGLQAWPLVEEPVRSVFNAADEKMLFISTYKDEIRTMVLGEEGWQTSSILNPLDEPVIHIFKGAEHEFWLCGLDQVHRVEIENQQIKTIQSIPVNNPNFDGTAGIFRKNEVVAINSQGFFKYDRSRQTFVPIDTLAKPLRYFASDNDIWFRDAHRWNLFGQHPGQSNLDLLNLFSDLRFIASDQTSDNLWLITGNNELYKFFGEKFTPYEPGYPLLLKSVRNDNRKVSRAGLMELDQEKSSVSFEIVQPDYLGSESVEYRYQLFGLEKGWSEWSSSYNIVDFPYLPAGEYTLMAQAKDIFGKVQDLPPVKFEVLPPYWKRPWFYAMEFALFASLVLLSFRLSTRYRFISRILSLLTIILLIQFIQTAIGETFETRTSPVKDFFVQVLVAFLILPVEGYLRKLMLRSLGAQTALHRFVSPKPPVAVEEKQEEN
ncbi:triple tyrosine motif-containing protein [Chryseolinea soli]|nr:triple tyrosine motif-containing protein [Chryseolinea soli]